MNFKKSLSAYFPGIILFIISMLIGMLTYKDYGVAWDESAQRDPGLLSFQYIRNGSQELFLAPNDYHGAGFELLLVFIEKSLRLKNYNDIFEMRHFVTHVFFLISALFAYGLILRLFKDKWFACLGFIILVLSPRIYAHSFINSKDVPFLCMLIITLALCQAAFEKNKKWLFLLLGVACGFATSIRIMGLMYACFIISFLIIDLAADIKRKEKPTRQLVNIALFSAGFCFLLYISWPYIWKSPVQKLEKAFSVMSHFDLVDVPVLINSKLSSSLNLPWTYFPMWFLISNPVLWLVSGFSGVALVIINFLKNPLVFFKNTRERNFMLYLFCFAMPVFAVIILHSVLYEDCRHMYFVYPPFILLALYFIDKVFRTRFKFIMQSLCAIQIGFIGYFMVRNHPFQLVYFNGLVSHKKEYLRRHYEMDYWGCSMKQALDYLLKTNPDTVIKISSDFWCGIPLNHNILMLNERDRKRIEHVTPDAADYFITDFRGHPQDYSYQKIDYSITVLNSTIMCIYKTH